MSSPWAEAGRPDPPPVGSLGEEAVKLLAVVSSWAEEHTAASDTGHPEECRYCPVCRLVSAARSTSPEVRRHLREAGSSLLQAAAGLLATEEQTTEQQEGD